MKKGHIGVFWDMVDHQIPMISPSKMHEPTECGCSPVPMHTQPCAWVPHVAPGVVGNRIPGYSSSLQTLRTSGPGTPDLSPSYHPAFPEEWGQQHICIEAYRSHFDSSEGREATSSFATKKILATVLVSPPKEVLLTASIRSPYQVRDLHQWNPLKVSPCFSVFLHVWRFNPGSISRRRPSWCQQWRRWRSRYQAPPGAKASAARDSAPTPWTPKITRLQWGNPWSLYALVAVSLCHQFSWQVLDTSWDMSWNLSQASFDG